MSYISGYSQDTPRYRDADDSKEQSRSLHYSAANRNSGSNGSPSSSSSSSCSMPQPPDSSAAPLPASRASATSSSAANQEAAPSALQFLQNLKQAKPKTLADIQSLYSFYHGRARCAEVYKKLIGIPLPSHHGQTGCAAALKIEPGKTQYTICPLAIAYAAVCEEFAALETEEREARQTHIGSFGTAPLCGRLLTPQNHLLAAVDNVLRDFNSDSADDDIDALHRTTSEEQFQQMLFQEALGLSSRQLAQFAHEKQIPISLKTLTAKNFQILLCQSSSRQSVLNSIFGKFSHEDYVTIAIAMGILPELLNRDNLLALLDKPSFRGRLLERLYFKLDPEESEKLKSALFPDGALPDSEQQIKLLVIAHRYGNLSNEDLADLVASNPLTNDDIMYLMSDEHCKKLFTDALSTRISVEKFSTIAMEKGVLLPPHRLSSNNVEALLRQPDSRKAILKQIYDHPSARELVETARKTADERAHVIVSSQSSLSPKEFEAAHQMAVQEAAAEFGEELGRAQEYVEIGKEMEMLMTEKLIDELVEELDTIEGIKLQRELARLPEDSADDKKAEILKKLGFIKARQVQREIARENAAEKKLKKELARLPEAGADVRKAEILHELSLIEERRLARQEAAIL